MSAELYTEPELLAETASRLERTGADLAAALDRLGSVVGGTGNPWGADQQGSMFAALYTELSTHVIDVVSGHRDELGYAAGSLRAAADLQVRTDADVASAVTGLGQTLGGI